MVEYRVVKRPACLVKSDLTEDELAMVMDGGNDAAIGTNVVDGVHAGQLDLWHRTNKTIVAGRLGDGSFVTWSFKGYVGPEDCRTWYQAKIAA